jgi:hypothetical protein
MKNRLYLAWFTTITTTLVALNAPSMAWAHPGHGETDSGPAHYLLEPVHSIMFTGMIVCGIAVTAFMLATKTQQPSQSE